MTNSLSTADTSIIATNAAEDSFKKEFFQNLYNLESGNFWFRNRNKLIIWALKKFFPAANNFLEIGCGTGFVLSGIGKTLPHLELCGSELFDEGLVFAQHRVPNSKLIQLDARQLPYTKAFDVIGAFDVIEHIEEDEQVLKEVYRACRQGIVLTVPQHKWLWSYQDEHSCHKRRYTRKELVKKVEAAGFTVAFSSSFVSLLLPIMLLSRLRKKASDDFDVTAELRLPALANKLLEIILQVELFLIGNSVRLPAGGSLLLIATRSHQGGVER